MPVDPMEGRASYYRLGNEYPYFSFYRDDDCDNAKGYINLSFLIKDAEFNLQAVKGTPSFAIKQLDRYLYLTLDLGKTTLKKGDTIKINAIIMPWGSQESDYTLEDKNVRDVRENTLINNLRVEAVTACEVVENDWLPEVRLTNGVVGSFIVKGASGNSTITISGVKTLCIPMVHEKVEEETGTYWVRYNLSSRYYADNRGYGQSYDGYAVQYNEDGTYTYSFVIDMSEGKDREFKVTFSEAFEEEPMPEDGVLGGSGPSIYFNIDSFCSNNDLKNTRYFGPMIFDGNHDAYPKNQNYVDSIVTTNPDNKGKMFFQAWAGTMFEVTGVQYRVLNEDGDVIRDWTTPEQDYKYFVDQSEGVLKNVHENLSEEAFSYRVGGGMHLYTIDGITEPYNYVTVEIAFVMAEPVEGEDHYVFMTAKNVKVTR